MALGSPVPCLHVLKSPVPVPMAPGSLVLHVLQSLILVPNPFPLCAAVLKSCPHGVPGALSAGAGMPGPCLHAVGIFRHLPACTSVPSLHSHIFRVCGPLPVCAGIPGPHQCDIGVLSPLSVCARGPCPCGSGVPCPPPVHAWLPAPCFCSVGIPDPPFPACAGSLVPIPMPLASTALPCLDRAPLSPFVFPWSPSALPACVGLPCSCDIGVLGPSTCQLTLSLWHWGPHSLPLEHSLAPRVLRESFQGDVTKGPVPKPTVPSLSPLWMEMRAAMR